MTQQVIAGEVALNRTRRIFFDWVEVLEARIKGFGDSDARIQDVRDEHLHLLQMYAALGRNDERILPTDLDRTFKDIYDNIVKAFCLQSALRLSLVTSIGILVPIRNHIPCSRTSSYISWDTLDTDPPE